LGQKTTDGWAKKQPFISEAIGKRFKQSRFGQKLQPMAGKVQSKPGWAKNNLL